MKELFINRARTCAFTGHRIIEKDFDQNKLKNVLNSLVGLGCDTFLVGMALGFDTLCFRFLEQIREKTKIKIIACVPCEDQPLKFSEKQKIEYERMLLSADEIVYLGQKYDEQCMMRRNKYMVDNASILVSYLRYDKSGTKKTVEYAKKQKIEIIEL